MIVGTTDSIGSRAGNRASRAESARTKNLSEGVYSRPAPQGEGSRDIPLYVFEKRMVCLKEGKSQANEGMWGMPGHIEAMKAAVSCDKLGGAAHTH